MRTENVTCDNCSGPIGWCPTMAQFIIHTDGVGDRVVCSVKSESGADLCGACQCRIAISAATKALPLVAPGQMDDIDPTTD